MIKRRELPKPTEGELELLCVLWKKAEATVREIYEEINRTRALGYTSVLKALQIMTAKGLVQRTEAGRAHVYRASCSQEQTQTQLLKDISTRLFSGSAARLAMHALSLQPASAEELKQMRSMIEERMRSL